MRKKNIIMESDQPSIERLQENDSSTVIGSPERCPRHQSSQDRTDRCSPWYEEGWADVAGGATFKGTLVYHRTIFAGEPSNVEALRKRALPSRHLAPSTWREACLISD